MRGAAQVNTGGTRHRQGAERGEPEAKEFLRPVARGDAVRERRLCRFAGGKKCAAANYFRGQEARNMRGSDEARKKISPGIISGRSSRPPPPTKNE